MKRILSFLVAFMMAFMHLAAYAQVQKLPSDTIQMGKGSASNKQIIFDNGAGSSNPRFRYNNANNKLEFSVDGVTYYTFASSNGSETLTGKTLETLNLSVQAIPSAASIVDMSGAKAIAIITGSTATTLSGIANGVVGKVQTVVNATGVDMVVKGEDAAATADNRIALAGATQIKVKANSAIDFVYVTGNRWFVKGGSGSGSSSTTENLLADGDIENGSMTDWKCFNSAATTRPVDGMSFGTSPTVTFQSSDVNPIKDNYSAILTKTAANSQGQGCYRDFTIQDGDLAKVLKIESEYKVHSGTFVPGQGPPTPVDSDVIWYIYDVTNGKVIEPSSIKLLSNSTAFTDIYSSTFQTAYNSKSYRLIAYFPTTSAAAFALKIDNIKILRSKYVYGTPITDWQSYTPTIANLGAGSYTLNRAKFRRVGDNAEVDVRATKDGTNGTGASTVYIPLPSGLVPDPVKTNSTGWGSFAAYTSNSAVNVNSVTSFVDVTQNAIVFVNGGVSITGSSWASGTLWSTTVSVPITGWSSSVQMSSDAGDSRGVVFKGKLTGATTLGNNLAVGNVTRDSHGAWNSTSSYFSAPSSGDYKMAATIPVNLAVNAVAELHVYKNGVMLETIARAVNNNASVASVQTLNGATVAENIKIGDQLSFVITNSVNTVSQSTFTVSASYGQVSIAKEPGSFGAIAATETVMFIGRNSSAPSLTSGSSTLITYPTVVSNSHGSFNGSTGIFKAPSAGLYLFAAIGSVAATTSAGDLVGLLYVNGGEYGRTSRVPFASTANGNHVSGFWLVPLKQDDTVSFYLNQTNGTTRSLEALGTSNMFMGARVGL